MCFYIVNRHGSPLHAFGKGVSAIFDTCDTGINTLNVIEVLLFKQGDLLLEICSILHKALNEFFEEVDIRFGLDSVLAFFCTVCGKRVAHFLVLKFYLLKCRNHLLKSVNFLAIGASGI